MQFSFALDYQQDDSHTVLFLVRKCYQRVEQ